MNGDSAYRRLLQSLWVLLRTAGVNAPVAALAAAAETCHGSLQAALRSDAHVVLQEREGALFANAVCIRPTVDSFSAVTGLAALLQERKVRELLLLPAATAASLLAFARLWHEAPPGELEARLRAGACIGVHCGAHDVVAAAAPAPPPGGRSGSSQLGAVFTLQQFTADLAAHGPLGGRRARAALQNVLDALLRSPAGLLPLMRLRRDRDASVGAVRACALAVRTAQELGWPEDKCNAAGIEALLGDQHQHGGDREATDLGQAARTVAVLTQPDVAAAAVEQLERNGELPHALAAAMAAALQGPG